jgi:transcriptional regulator with XRE-family HTH domain
LPVTLNSPQDIAVGLRDRFKQRRLSMNLTQAGLAKRAGVNMWSLKRFEAIGQIALESLLKLALVLDCLDDFQQVCTGASQSAAPQSLDQILARGRRRRRSRLT